MNETGGGLQQDWVDKKSHRLAGYLVYLVPWTWLPCLNQNGSEPVNENGGQQELVNKSMQFRLTRLVSIKMNQKQESF